MSDCDQQTWPYITPQCLTEREETAQRKVRVITTDKIAPVVVSAIEQGGEDVPRNEDPVAQKDRPAREAANLSSGETMPAVTAKASPIGASTTPTRETKSMPVTAPPLIEQSSAPATDPQTAATDEPAVAKEQPPNANPRMCARLATTASVKPNSAVHPYGIVMMTTMNPFIHPARVSWSVGLNARFSSRTKPQSASI